jgi:hypothetical protein
MDDETQGEYCISWRDGRYIQNFNVKAKEKSRFAG